MIQLSILLASLFMTGPASRAGEIAFTFDDAPRKSTCLTGEARTARLLAALKSAQIRQVAFFTTTGGMDAQGRKRILKYAEAGHLIANHSHAHLSLDRVGPEPFLQDFEKAHEVLKSWLNFRPWFRFPFLHEGRTVEHRDAARAGLKKLGYLNGYVTVDNSDWLMDSLFQKAVSEGRRVRFDRLEALYVETLWSGIQFYDRIARETLGRSPKHVLLLHENDLTAMHVGALIES